MMRDLYVPTDVKSRTGRNTNVRLLSYTEARGYIEHKTRGRNRK